MDSLRCFVHHTVWTLHGLRSRFQGFGFWVQGYLELKGLGLRVILPHSKLTKLDLSTWLFHALFSNLSYLEVR